MKYLIAYISSIAVSVVTATLIAFLFGGLTREIAVFSLLVGLLTAIFIVFKYPNLSSGLTKKDFNFWTIVAITTFLLFSLKAFLWLVFKRGDSLRVLSANNLGDLPLHITFIQYLANGVQFWPDNPIYTSSKIHYPIGIDLFNSLLVLSGMDLVQSLIWVGVLSSIATLFALIVWGKSFTLLGFLFSGGFSGFQFFRAFVFSDYQASLAWKNLFLSIFIPQRGFLFALPSGLLLLSSWRERYFAAKKNSDSAALRACHGMPLLPFWVEVLLYLSMPMFHMHTFIFLSLLLLIWLVICPNQVRFQILKLLGASSIGAGLFVMLLTNFFRKSSMVHVQWGWVQGSQKFLIFWLLNFGVFLPLVVWLCLQLLVKKRNEAFVFPAIFLFIFFCNVMMTPWDWDNAKFLLWSYIVLLPFIWENLISRWNVFFKYFICFLLFFSGFVCTVGTLSNPEGHEIFKISELREVTKVVKDLPIENRFACFPTYNHPLLFCGRKVVLGYPGWVWSHGYDVSTPNQKLRKLMMGEKNWKKLASELGVQYIFWGPCEEKEYLSSLKPWEKDCKKLASCEWGEVYKLKD